MCRSALYHLRNIGSVRKHLTETAAAQLIHSLVTTRIDYCNSLLVGVPDKRLNKLQRVQNIAARILTRTQKTSHITPVLYQLHWLPIKARIMYKLLIVTYQAYHSLAPSYLCDLVTPHIPSRSLRSGDQLMLVEPRTRLKTFGDRSFSAAGPREWNKLPQTLRSATSLLSFKTQLKTYLFKTFYNC